jgi:DNA-binding PadR family transcriptional regulator
MTRRVINKPMPAASMYLLLALLAGENHGYALMRLVDEQSQGAVHMGPGTLYGTLNRLLADGLIVETTDDSDRTGNERRRYYRLNHDGERVAHVELHRLRTLVNRFRTVPGISGAPA